MADKTQIALTLLEILIAIGSFKALEIFIKYLINRKKDKTNNIEDLYKKYSDSCDTYIEQTASMQVTITELRNESLEMGKRIIEMDKKLDEKNQIIMNLKAEIIELVNKTQQNTKIISDLLKRAEFLDSIKCEREPCDNRIPPKHKDRKIKSAKA